MTEKLNSNKVAISLAAVAGMISIICALLILIAPESATNLLGQIFHGIDISQIAKPISLGNAVLGTIEVIILALIAGWLFAKIYNKIY